MTPAQAAKYLGVHIGTLANWRCAKRGPRFRYLHHGEAKFVDYRKSDLIKFKRGYHVV